MIALLLALVGTAQATNWGEPKPYVVPRIGGSLVSVNGVVSTQVYGGAEAGVIVRDRHKPHWFSQSRVSAIGQYGFASNSLGGDFRIGSFFGPDGKVARLLSGPDVWFNGYGKVGALDYHLPWSPGVDLRNTVLFKVADGVRITGEVTPGWAFFPERQTAIDDLIVCHELTLGATANLDLGAFSITLGYARVWNSAGANDYLILGAGL